MKPAISPSHKRIETALASHARELKKPFAGISRAQYKAARREFATPAGRGPVFPG